MLALSSFLGEVSSKARLPKADILGRVIESETQVSGTSFLHVGVAVMHLPRLICRGGHPCIGQQFVRRIKPGKVAHLRKNHGSHSAADSRNRGDWRMKFIHNVLNSGFNIINLGVQFSNEPNGVLQFQRLGRHSGAD